MADYRELLRRAVDALPENNGTSRRAVYEKAREALVTQLRAIEPPLPAREITQHRLTLEDCIRQVEQEATETLLKGLTHEAEAPEPVAAAPVVADEPELPAKTDAQVQLDEAEEAPIVEPTPAEESALEPTTLVSDAQVEQEETPAEVDTPADVVPVVEQEVVVAEPEAAPELEETSADPIDEHPVVEPEPAVDEPAKSEIKQVEDIVATKKSAVEEIVEEVVPTLETVKTPEEKPALNPVDEVIAQAQAASASAITTPSVDLKPDAKSQGRENFAPTVSPALSSVREVEVDEAPATAAISVGGDEPQAAIDRAIKALDMEAEGKDTTTLTPEGRDEKDADNLAVAEPVAGKLLDDLSETPIVDDEETGGNGLTVFLLLVILLLAGAGGGAYWAWKEGYVDLNPLMSQLGLAEKAPVEQTSDTTVTEEPIITDDGQVTQSNVRDVTPLSASNDLTEAVTETAPVVEETTTPDADDRLETEPAPTEEVSETPTPVEETPEVPTTEEPAVETGERLVAEEDVTDADQPQLNVGETSEPAAEIGSRSLLIEEQLSGTGGAVPFTGETVWSRDVDETGAPVIKAAVSVPARNLMVNVLFRKNSDPSLPASHLVEVNFSVTESFLGGGIASLPGILLKDEELAQGNPLVGASARIFDNSFLFALSAAEADLAKNIGLISQRGWIDLPVVYSTGRKAIVTLEKGKEGGAIFEAVLAAWAAE